MNKVKRILKTQLEKCKICLLILKNKLIIFIKNKIIFHKIKAYNKINLKKYKLNNFNMMKKYNIKIKS